MPVLRPRPAALLALFGLALATAGCGASGPASVRRPAPLNERAIREPRPPAQSPKLIAPPPAYGNKIVMAMSSPPPR